MRVKVESFGGIVGPMAGERSAADLSADQLRALATLRQKPAAPVSPGPAPYYRITVTDEQGVHQLDVPERDMPDELTSIATPNP